MGLAAGIALVIVAGLMGYVRLAPEDMGRWHVALDGVAIGPGVTKVPGGAVGFVASATPAARLARLAEVVAAVPRTKVVAGAVAEGRITWVSRSLVWGFPDYITAQVAPDGLRLWSRQRFGRQDYGVNARRLTDWMAGL